MNPNDIKALIDQLLKTGEILATQAFRISMREIIVSGYMDIGYAAVYLILLVVAIILTIKAIKSEIDASIGTISMILMIFFGGFFISMLNEGVHYLLNPEWYAVKLLLEQFFK